ncbi:GDP-mannose dehydrogenase, partial [bacterium]|nr:GDP-mannose dehydrogenase [bacterium]
DLRAIVRMSQELNLDCPVLAGAMPSNKIHIQRAIDHIRGTGKKKVGVLGMSFKAETDDLRESPIVQVVSTLIGKGYELCIYDENISWQELFGANLGFLEHELPYAETLKAASVDDLLERSEVIVVANGAEEFRDVPLRMREDQIMLDLVRIVDDPSVVRGTYIGIAW